MVYMCVSHSDLFLKKRLKINFYMVRNSKKAKSKLLLGMTMPLGVPTEVPESQPLQSYTQPHSWLIYPTVATLPALYMKLYVFSFKNFLDFSSCLAESNERVFMATCS